jgi:hypothetical protein
MVRRREPNPSPSPLDNSLRRGEAEAAAGLVAREQEERQGRLLHEVHRLWDLVKRFCVDGEDAFAGRLCDLLAAVRADGLGDRLGQLERGDDVKRDALAVYGLAEANRKGEVAAAARRLVESVRRAGRAGDTHQELRGWLCTGLMREILAPAPEPARKLRGCYERDHTFLEWSAHMTDAEIRDRWNRERPGDAIARGGRGADVVKKGRRRAAKEREAEQRNGQNF